VGWEQDFMATLHTRTRAATDGAKTTLDMAVLGMEPSKKEMTEIRKF
jgi:hypothetical protein